MARGNFIIIENALLKRPNFLSNQGLSYLVFHCIAIELDWFNKKKLGNLCKNTILIPVELIANFQLGDTGKSVELSVVNMLTNRFLYLPKC